MTIIRDTNAYQTSLNIELRDSVPKRVWDDLIDFIDSIPFIQNLIAPEKIRKHAQDLTRWDEPNEDDEEYRTLNPNGKIRVSFENPHILEDMDYFRSAAITFEKNKRYTLLTPNRNPNSEYSKFWIQEFDRWKNGMVRPSDGEWITGAHYFYLNYSQIDINEEIEGSKGKKNKARVKGRRKKEFPRMWLGDYLWFHYMQRARDNGEHCKLLKKRGCGFSFKFGAISPHSMYVNKDMPNFHLASEKVYLEGEKGIFSKVVNTLDWVGTHTPFPKERLINKSLEKKLGYTNKGDDTEFGLKSSVFAISLKDNPDKARGVRGPIVQYEEDGIFPDIIDAWMVNLEATEEGGIVFGLMVSGGTGGTAGANFEGSEKMFNDPGTYHIYGIPNFYEKNSKGAKKCGFFWGAYLNRSRCYDEINGEPDVIRALLEVLTDREHVRKSSLDNKPLDKRKAEQPITPSEAMLKIDGTVFPTGDIKEYLTEIELDYQKFIGNHLAGTLDYNLENNLIFRNDTTVYPIREFPLNGDNRHGAIEIVERPKSIDRYRYVIGCDPIDYDYTKDGSLGSAFVFDLLEDRFVAEYTGRPRTADEFFEIVLRLAKYYNAVINYESNLKGMFSYFKNKNYEHLLADTPKLLKDTLLIKSIGFGNRSVGTPANKNINSFARKLLADWMITERIISNGETSKTVLNLHTIRSVGLLKECRVWNIDDNFDRISAAGMVMIIRQEYQKNIEFIKNPNKSKRKIYDDKLLKKFAR